MQTEIHYLTKEGHQKLEHELEYLKDIRRREVARHLSEALAGGDNPTENFALETIRVEQAFLEGRIRDLEDRLAKAEVYYKEDLQEEVQIGCRVTFQQDNHENITYEIVGEGESNPEQHKISYLSPLGASLLHHHTGDVVKVNAPDETFHVKLLRID